MAHWHGAWAEGHFPSGEIESAGHMGSGSRRSRSEESSYNRAEARHTASGKAKEFKPTPRHKALLKSVEGSHAVNGHCELVPVVKHTTWHAM